MSILGYIIVFVLLGSLASLIGGLLLLWKQNIAKSFSHYLTSFAAGTLLGAAFFDLLPEAVEMGDAHEVFLYVVFGMLFLFFAERTFHWFHHHSYTEDEQIHDKKPVIPLLIFSDTVHNFIDGIVIALTFMVSIPLGIVTSLAVIAHEMPQEIGDFGAMLHYGMQRKKILLVNIASACAALLGAVMAYVLGDAIAGYVPLFLAVAAGFFIYIAAADLLPEIHHEDRQKVATIQSILLVFGVLLVWVAVNTFGHH